MLAETVGQETLTGAIGGGVVLLLGALAKFLQAKARGTSAKLNGSGTGACTAGNGPRCIDHATRLSTIEANEKATGRTLDELKQTVSETHACVQRIELQLARHTGQKGE